MKPILSIGLSDADRTRAIADGLVTIEGVEARPEILPLQPLFNIQLTTHRFDLCEFPIATWLRHFDRPQQDYIGIPVFPSRHFRFSCVFVHKGRGLDHPSKLVGKRIGTPVWDMAAAVWLRGIFDEHYGLPRRSPIYVNAGLNEKRGGEDHPQEYPAGHIIDHAGPDRHLSEMLEKGEIDALYTARAPDSFFSAPDRVARLFPNSMEAELDYFRRTGIHPPMHLICVKRRFVEEHPWLPRALYDAFAESQRVAQRRLHDSATLSTMLPWLHEHIEMTERALGPDFWSSGFRANRDTFALLIRYMREEGLLQRELAPEDLFPASLLET
ncbi:ABC transporter substrate-binding protein [Rhodovarius crocodyli]|uniref:ABC transporter substrate-binding protein n=1 Tax=Rhodovarius crocodyli TaxID=1979269 RepID=A0A437LXK8_9PROT|nr:ABC transporter substrate-binding protein [Rhodovarius crocodyli]RVT90084.1 ABC transporter substrate-binding protein [Rhodovarius crocodyli]